VTPEAPGKGEQTRQRIVEAALRLFEEKGYAGTTMRSVAGEAGVSLGNAYYYFRSKDHLIQGFYDALQERHLALARTVWPQTRSLTERLVRVEHAWVEVARPYHEFASQFFAVAADPTSPSSPFSTESRAARETSLQVFREALAGADLKVSPELAERLPEVLWLAHLGVTLHWVHDPTPEQRRTIAVIDQAVPLGVRLLKLTRLPPARPIVRQVLAVMDTVSGR
jgi:AcrR family transcriptional regulator